MEAVFTKLLHMSLSASWLILAVLLLRPLLKKAPRWVFCLLWAMVALRLICPFAPESSLSLLPAGDGFLRSHLPEGKPRAALVWLLGMAGLLLYGGYTAVRLRWSVREAVLLDGNAWRCDWVRSPFILGVLRPRIYLPSHLALEQRAYVLAHERAHLRRRDHWWKPGAFVLLAMYWFNPLVWTMYLLLCRDIEQACDEAVVEEMTIEGKKGYSLALLACGVPRRSIAACPLAFGAGSVKGRVKNVLNFRTPTFWILAVSAAAATLLTVSFLTDPRSLPMPQAPDRSFLNYENLIPLAEDQASIDLSIRGWESAVSGKDLAELLRNAGWKETPPPDPAPETYFTARFCDFLELRFFASRQDLAQVVCGADSQYYHISPEQYAAFRDLLLANIPQAEPELPKLTLEDVVTLSSQGQDFTTAALYPYQAEESMFGWVCPINRLFSLWVGDEGGDGRPGYVWLQVNDPVGSRIDIREADVTAFIAQYREALLNIAVAETLAAFAKDQPLDGAYPGESYEILSSSITEQASEAQAVLYLRALYGKFTATDHRITGRSCLSEAVILTFRINKAGMCTLTDSWRAGSCDNPEIRERFPEEAGSKAMEAGYPSYLMEQARRIALTRMEARDKEGETIS